MKFELNGKVFINNAKHFIKYSPILLQQSKESDCIVLEPICLEHEYINIFKLFDKLNDRCHILIKNVNVGISNIHKRKLTHHTN